MIKMGKYLAELRKEHKLTQAELGAKLGTTNKTVSRWETGKYMPPVEMLEELSKLYGLTINELLSGRRLTATEYKEAAESNIRATLRASTFDLKEKQEFWKKKWRREHIAVLVACAAVWLVVLLLLKTFGVAAYLLGAFGGVLFVLIYAWLNNRMMAYVEDHMYGGTWDTYKWNSEDQ